MFVTECPNSELLRQLVSIAGSLPGAEGQLARAYYKLSSIYAHMQRNNETQRFRRKAMEVKANRRP